MSRFNSIARISAAVLAAVLTVGFAGCSTQSAQDTQASAQQPTPILSDQPQAASVPHPSEGQKTFDTPDAAVAALLSALDSNDHADLRTIFGPEAKDLVTGDPVTDANSYKSFSQEALERAQLEERDPNTDILHIGANDWPF